jgi:lipoprotein Spr
MKKTLLILLFSLISNLINGQIKDSTLTSFVNEWLGVKYKLGGSTKRGIDCSQFSKKLYKNVYGKTIGNNCQTQWRQSNRIRKEELIIGDVVFFKSRQSPSGWHCGVFIGDDKFVHAANRYEGVKISSLLEPRYHKNYKGSGRFN